PRAARAASASPRRRCARARGGSRRAESRQSVGLFRELRQLRAHAPELRIHLVLDQAGEQVDRCALRADDVLADDPRHDLEVAEAPDADALVPLGELLGELVEILVLASARVDLEQREAALLAESVEGAVER